MFRFDSRKIKGSLIVDLESLGARPEVQGRLGCFSTALLKNYSHPRMACAMV
jgi:hypothetical protein